MSQIRAAIVVAVGLGGLWLALSAHPRLRRATLAERLTPYLGAINPRTSMMMPSDVNASGIRSALLPLITALARQLQRLLGDDGSDLEGRLAASASTITPSEFRAQQVAWGLGGATAGIAGCVFLVMVGRPVSVVLALALGGVGAATGVVLRDRRLTTAVRRRRASAEAEIPTVVDMVCIAVAAGESLRGSLEVVARSGDGPIAHELRAALAAARSGVSLSDALDARARRLGLAAFERVVTAVTASQDRGIPLADSLRAMAFDVREARKRDLIEAAGKKQVSMLAPVVGLILPVAIVFAFYPGVVAIRTLAR